MLILKTNLPTECGKSLIRSWVGLVLFRTFRMGFIMVLEPAYPFLHDYGRQRLNN